MYTAFLHTHSTLAYVVFALLIITIIRWITKTAQNATFTNTDRKWVKFTVMAVHIQFLIGLILYVFLSPITQEAFADVGEAMRNAKLRFILVEHFSTNLLAVVAITVASVRSKKLPTDKLKFKNLALLFAIGFVLLLSRVPWANWWNLN